MANEIVYGFAETPFGTIIVARTIDGICDLQFLGWNRMEVIHELARHWGTYTPTTQNARMADTVKRVIFDGYDHHLALDLRGTDFQNISYQQLAERVGQPKAVRAVASAVAENRIALLVPCHRIIHKDGTTGEYHWGRELKKQLIAWEKTTTENV